MHHWKFLYRSIKVSNQNSFWPFNHGFLKSWPWSQAEAKWSKDRDRLARPSAPPSKFAPSLPRWHYYHYRLIFQTYSLNLETMNNEFRPEKTSVKVKSIASDVVLLSSMLANSIIFYTFNSLTSCFSCRVTRAIFLFENFYVSLTSHHSHQATQDSNLAFDYKSVCCEIFKLRSK